MKKKLAKYLAEYIEYERLDVDDSIDEIADIIEQGIEAFESIEDVEIFIRHLFGQPRI